jgi:hypothetical protein
VSSFDIENKIFRFFADLAFYLESRLDLDAEQETQFWEMSVLVFVFI